MPRVGAGRRLILSLPADLLPLSCHSRVPTFLLDQMGKIQVVGLGKPRSIPELPFSEAAPRQDLVQGPAHLALSL